MTTRDAETLLTVLGFARESSRFYDRVLPLAGRSLAEVADTLLCTPDEVRAGLAELSRAGIAEVTEERVSVLLPPEAVARMLTTMAADAARCHVLLADIARSVPYLTGTTTRVPLARVGDTQPIDGEVYASPNIAESLETLVRRNVGELRWLRPDQWALPWEDKMITLVTDAVAQGRRCRAMYPIVAMSEAPKVLAARVEAGEEIRLLPDVPSRLLVIGESCGVLPEPLGHAGTPRLVVRQRGIVEALALLFDLLWAGGTRLEELDNDRAETTRALLVEQLATGAADEQIARRLGVSLRTVRRRVADLMVELGVESRFQAGVEAVRRGWL
ncbi:MAG: LuxR C-terminal-related transcriptional regulator [Nocardioides sp.]|uniref:helix-turn-helix domain-containing protein n=1 Tax=Nocardioides sp. TaxID=35761 RepID=UPI0039E4B3E8